MKYHSRIEEIQKTIGENAAIVLLQAGNKKPLEKHSGLSARNYQDIQSLLARYTRNGSIPNLGILCGSPSNGIIVIDIDDPSLFNREMPGLYQWLEASTLLVQTQKGFHAYFVIDEPVRTTNDTLKLKGYEIRAEKSYVVAPGSIVKGHFYRPLNDRPPLTVNVEDLNRQGFSLKVNDPAKMYSRKQVLQPYSNARNLYQNHPLDLVSAAIDYLCIIPTDMQYIVTGENPDSEVNGQGFQSRSEAEFMLVRRMVDAAIPDQCIIDYFLHHLSAGTHFGELNQSAKIPDMNRKLERVRTEKPPFRKKSDIEKHQKKQFLQHLLFTLRANVLPPDYEPLTPREQIVLESLIVRAISVGTVEIAVSQRDLSIITLATIPIISKTVKTLKDKNYISWSSMSHRPSAHSTLYTIINPFPSWSSTNKAPTTNEFNFIPLPHAIFSYRALGMAAFFVWRAVLLKPLTTIDAVVQHFDDGLLRLCPQTVVRIITLIADAGLIKLDRKTISLAEPDWQKLSKDYNVERKRSIMDARYSEQSFAHRKVVTDLSKQKSPEIFTSQNPTEGLPEANEDIQEEAK